MMGAFERVFHKELSEALNRGLTQGLSQGLSEGRSEGITIGEQRARRSIMENLIAGGMDPGQAASFTGLSV